VEGEEILAKRPSHASVETRVSHWLAWHVDVKRRERLRTTKTTILTTIITTITTKFIGTLAV